MIKHNQPSLPYKSIEDVKNCINSKNLSTKKLVQKFEDTFCKKYYKCGQSVLVSSGTSALYLAIKSLKKDKKKSRILIPSYACSALLNAIYLANCEPVIADIDKKSFTLSTNRKYKNIDIIILVNIYGSNPNLKDIKKKYPKSKIILDACHSIGMKIESQSDIFLSDIIIHSFYATKIITCGHGGLIWSKTKKYIDFCKDYINFDLNKSYKKKFNFLISDLQVSLLFEQLKKIEKIRKFRNNVFLKYKNSASENVNFFSPYDFRRDIVYRAVLIFKSSIKRNSFKKKLFKNKIESIIPIDNFELLHNYIKLDKKYFINSEEIAKKTLSLPLHLALSNKQVNKICKILKKI